MEQTAISPSLTIRKGASHDQILPQDAAGDAGLGSGLRRAAGLGFHPAAAGLEFAAQSDRLKQQRRPAA
ncbi:hypothetical protein SDC9_190920 [bioreactor metagenome]|uniref:Uncharacterized protein n=1 Tax=bioreactor metagenome TaxID=1076179 RepID=A0A645HWD0_9ZZZZ